MYSAFSVPVLPDVSPMPASLAPEPFHRDGWVYEEKVDGWRMVTYKDGRSVRPVSRKGLVSIGYSEMTQGRVDGRGFRRLMPNRFY